MRALVIVLESVGIGHAPDAAAYHDEGSNTLGHLLDKFPDLKLPNLWKLGLGHILRRDPVPRPLASFGRMTPISTGKDSTTGHWELAGVILNTPLMRTANRHDFPIPPPRTALNHLAEAGVPVIGIGETSELFAGSGFTQSHPTQSNAQGMQLMQELWPSMKDGLLFTNLVDFDAIFGRQRDPAGYAKALKQFDDWLGPFLRSVSCTDLLIITADHGNDPTYQGTGHTREQVPVLMHYNHLSQDLGTRKFADVAQTLISFFGLEEWEEGYTMLDPEQLPPREPPKRRSKRTAEAKPGRDLEFASASKEKRSGKKPASKQL